MRASVLALVLASGACLAQDRPVRVCVGVPVNNSRMMISESLQRDRLVRMIESIGKSKKAKVKMTAVGLEGSTARETTAESRDMDCRYIVLSEFASIGGRYMPPTSRIPTIGSMGQSPQRNAQLNYSILDVESGAPERQGIVPILDEEDDSAALQAIRELGDRVIKEVGRRAASRPD